MLNNRKRDPNVIYALFIRILYASLLYKKNEKRCNDMIVKSLSKDFGNDHAVRELDMPIPCEETCRNFWPGSFHKYEKSNNAIEARNNKNGSYTVLLPSSY